MDFAFGSYSNDALKLANHRAAHQGVQHQNQISPLDPRPDDDVNLHVVTTSEAGMEHVAAYYTTDESTPGGSRGVAQNGDCIVFERTKTEWNALIWDYVSHWEAVIPAQPENTLVQYTISAWADNGQEIFADWPYAKDRVDHAAMVYFKILAQDAVFEPGTPDKPTIFNYHVDTVQKPSWADNAIIYHVFIDRFHPGNNKHWLQTEDMSKPFGGTLWGVCDNLDYIADLGANCIWLSPTWVSPSAHGYDVADYDRVEPRLGGEDALRAVIAGAHQRGIRVLLDMVCNHVSDEHPFFVDALHNINSPYREWFFIDDKYDNGYKGFFGVASMPELNLANPAARDWMVNTAEYWLREYDVDGYRLDYATGPDPNFWAHFRRACKAINPECLIFGEITEPSNILRRYVGRLDGCLDFPLNEAIRRTYGWKTWDDRRMASYLQSHTSYFSADFVMPGFLDNHDMDRFYFIAQGDGASQLAALSLLLKRPHPVILLYGTEVGVSQQHSANGATLDVIRSPMLWGDDQDKDLLEKTRALLTSRREMLDRPSS